MPDKTLFQGTAKLYAVYRPKYPTKIFSLIKKYSSKKKDLRILDLGCGPGTLSIPLGKYAKELVAVDINNGMINEGRRQAKLANVKNIRWIVSPVENLETTIGKFDIIVFSNSFHWMNKRKVLKLVSKMLSPNGLLILISGHSWWNSNIPWHQTVITTIKKYLGQKRKAGKGLYKSSNSEKENEYKFETLLPTNGFNILFKDELFIKYYMSTEQIINFLYTMSFSAKHLFKGKHKLFEKELKANLNNLNKRNQFTEQTSFSLFICKNIHTQN